MDYCLDLPVDVVRLLMEAAAWSDRSTAHSLSLVSKDVRQWIEPILYHTVFLDTPTKVSAFAVSIVARTRDNPKISNLTIGGLDSEAFPLNDEDLDKSINDVVKACTNIERFSYWTPIQVEILDQITRYLRPSHVSLILGTQIHLSPYLNTLASPILTHLHLDFPSLFHLELCRGVWTGIFKESPRLTHFQLSGDAFDEMGPRHLTPTIRSIVSSVPQTIIRLLLCATSLSTQTDEAPIPVQSMRLQSDPRVVFILPINHALMTVEELRPREGCRDRTAYLDWRLSKDLWEVFEEIVGEQCSAGRADRDELA